MFYDGKENIWHLPWFRVFSFTKRLPVFVRWSWKSPTSLESLQPHLQKSNPTTNKLRILFMGSQLMLEQEKIIKITSLTGQTVFSFKQNGADDIVLDLDGLPSSPYMIYIISGNKVFVERISKVN